MGRKEREELVEFGIGSSEPVDLQVFLSSLAKEAGLNMVVLTDRQGALLGARAPDREAEHLAAISPLLANNKFFGNTADLDSSIQVEVREVRSGSRRLLLTAVGTKEARKACWHRMVEGMPNILSGKLTTPKNVTEPNRLRPGG